jgi:hypothetical protein
MNVKLPEPATDEQHSLLLHLVQYIQKSIFNDKILILPKQKVATFHIHDVHVLVKSIVMPDAEVKSAEEGRKTA